MNKEDRYLYKIEEILKSYKEEYQPGAWEEFAHENRKKTNVLLWQRWAGAVAVLVLLMYASVQFFSTGRSVKDRQSETTLSTKPSSKDSLHDNLPVRLNSDRQGKPSKKGLYSLTRMKERTSKETPSSRTEIIPKVFGNDKNNPLPERDLIIAKTNESNQNKEIDTVVSNPLKDYTKATENTGYESHPEPFENAKKDKKKLVYSLILSPSIGSQKLNFNSGLEVSYQLSHNLSLSGGIMYSSIHGAKNIDDLGQSSKKLRNVELAVSGFELPMSVQYHSKGGFFLTAALSGMTVTRQKLDYIYLTQVKEVVTIVSGGVPQQFVRIVSEETTEQSRQRTSNYIGFYSLSGGTKVKLGDRSVILGPFVKVPFGPVSSEKIKLLQGGLRIHWNFK